jgi:hypothetical protein
MGNQKKSPCRTGGELRCILIIFDFEDKIVSIRYKERGGFFKKDLWSDDTKLKPNFEIFRVDDEIIILFDFCDPKYHGYGFELTLREDKAKELAKAILERFES